MANTEETAPAQVQLLFQTSDHPQPEATPKANTNPVTMELSKINVQLEENASQGMGARDMTTLPLNFPSLPGFSENTRFSYNNAYVLVGENLV